MQLLIVKTNDGETPLHLAAEYGNEQTVSILINHNATINAKIKDGKTPLHLAGEN